MKLEYSLARGFSILDKINEPQVLAYVFAYASAAWMRREAFSKLERLEPDIIEGVKKGRYTLSEYFKVDKENATAKEPTSEVRLRFQNESFEYSEVINGWELNYTSDLYQEIAKLNIKEYQNDCLLDGVRLKPLNRSLLGIGLNIKAKVVCPKCHKIFDIEEYVGGGMGGSILKCTNCRFNFDFHYTGENGYYYLIAYTYVGKPYDIKKVPKPSIFVSRIENIQ